MGPTSAKAPQAEREAWVDAVKGFTILLVVLFHASRYQMFQVLVPLRMPLFFFVTGFFARRTLQLDWKQFLNTRFLHLVYLYVLWGAPLLVFYVHIRNREHGWGPWIAAWRFPLPTMWFLLALGLIYLMGRVMKAASPFTRFLLATALYVGCYAVGFVEIPGLSFIPWDNIIRLAPFFFLGTAAFPRIQTLAPFKWYAPLIAIAAYSGLVLAYRSVHPGYYPVAGSLTSIVWSFGISVTGICAAIMAFTSWRPLGGSRLLVYLGRNSLYLYILHEFFRLPGDLVLVRLLEATALSRWEYWFRLLLFFPMIVALCLLTKSLLYRLRLGVLFNKPSWIRIP